MINELIGGILLIIIILLIGFFMAFANCKGSEFFYKIFTKRTKKLNNSLSTPVLTWVNGEIIKTQFNLIETDNCDLSYPCGGCGRNVPIVYQNLVTKEIFCPVCFSKIIRKSNELAKNIQEKID